MEQPENIMTLGSSTAENDAKNRPRPAKRARKTESDNAKQSTKLRGNRGKLAHMLDMPMEVFCEIAGNLSPLDLLHMARCSKGLRGVLMSKSSKRVWEAARLNLEVPDCPSCSSEPAYAKFIFENECDGCGTRSPSVNYNLKVRYCQSCAKSNLLRGFDIVRDAFRGAVLDGKPIWQHHEVFQLVPSENSCRWRNEPNLERRKFDKTQLVKVINEYVKLDEAHRLTFRVEKAAEMVEVTKHAKRLTKWANAIERAKDSERTEQNKQRQQDVKERLLLAGYPEPQLELFFDAEYSHQWNRLIRNSRPVTDRTWKNLFPKLKKIMEKELDSLERSASYDRIPERHKEFFEHYQEYLNNLSEADKRFKPSVNEIILEPFAESLFERDYGKVVVTKEEWETHFRVPLEAFLAEYEEGIHGLLKLKITEAKDKFAVMPIEERVAPSSESCEQAVQGMNIDGAVTILRGEQVGSVYTIDSYLAGFRERKLVERWMFLWDRTINRLKKLEVDPNVACIASCLLLKLGRVPADTSMKDMVDQGRTFVCLCCPSELQKCRTWPELVHHFFEELQRHREAVRRNEKLVNFSSRESIPLVDDHTLSPDREIVAISASHPVGSCAENIHTHPDEVASRRKCVLCRALGMNFAVMYLKCAQVHVRAKHGCEPSEANISS